MLLTLPVFVIYFNAGAILLPLGDASDFYWAYFCQCVRRVHCGFLSFWPNAGLVWSGWDWTGLDCLSGCGDPAVARSVSSSGTVRSALRACAQSARALRGGVLAGPRAARALHLAQALPAVPGPPVRVRAHLVPVLRLRLAPPLRLPLDRPPRAGLRVRPPPTRDVRPVPYHCLLRLESVQLLA